MNALVSIDVATLTPATVFAPGGVEAIVSKIEAEVSAEVFTLETAEGRERIKSVAYKVARSKTALDNMGKELVAGIKAQAATIDAERRTIRDRLDALKESVRGPLTKWEDAEADRIALHESALVFLAEAGRFASPPSAATLRERIQSVNAAGNRDWQEFAERGVNAVADALDQLNTMLAAATKAEADAAELAELRRQTAERAEQDAKAAWQKAENERMQKATEEAAERERVRAEQQAKREQEGTEQAERDKIAAAARAVEQERERVARAKADEDRAAAKREANKKHRAKVHKEAMDALVAAGLSGPEANDLIGMIIDGKIPHVSITY
jgi:septal ring factor EnvC (AmiA/AmiB activator)